MTGIDDTRNSNNDERHNTQAMLLIIEVGVECEDLHENSTIPQHHNDVQNTTQTN